MIYMWKYNNIYFLFFIYSAKAGNLPGGIINGNPSEDTNNLNDKEKKSDGIIF